MRRQDIVQIPHHFKLTHYLDPTRIHCLVLFDEDIAVDRQLMVRMLPRTTGPPPHTASMYTRRTAYRDRRPPVLDVQC